MLKSEEAFEGFLTSRPEGYPSIPEKMRLLAAFIAGGDFGAQFVIDTVKEKHGTAQETSPVPDCIGCEIARQEFERMKVARQCGTCGKIHRALQL